jgi:hypothetical protein
MPATRPSTSNNIPPPPADLRWPTASEIAAGLNGHKTGNGRYMARCPCHADCTPSLSIFDGRNKQGVRRPYVACFAGCDWKDVQAELERRGLWPKFKRGRL